MWLFNKPQECQLHYFITEMKCVKFSVIISQVCSLVNYTRDGHHYYYYYRQELIRYSWGNTEVQSARPWEGLRAHASAVPALPDLCFCRAPLSRTSPELPLMKSVSLWVYWDSSLKEASIYIHRPQCKMLHFISLCPIIEFKVKYVTKCPCDSASPVTRSLCLTSVTSFRSTSYTV